MQFSQRYPFLNASENLRFPAADLEHPDLEACVNMYTDVNGVLQAPIPSFDFSDPPDPPCPITTPVTSYVDFVNVGSYVVALGANGESRRIWWCAPARPTVWALTEVVDTVTVKTGAGWNDLAGDGDILDNSNHALGQMAAIFDTQGVGALSLTGNWGAPFAYAKKVNSVYSYSEGYASEVDGLVYFIDQTGLLYATDGATITPINGPFNMKAIAGGGWPPYADAKLEYDLDLQRLVSYQSVIGKYWLIEPATGRYTSKYGSDIYLTTGSIPITKDDHAVHIQYVELETNVASGTPTVTLEFKETDAASFQTAVTLDPIPTGTETNRIWINQMVESSPQMKITLGNVTGTVKLHAYTIAYEDGGRR